MSAVCSLCGNSWHGHGTAFPPAKPVDPAFGRYQFTPYQLTEADIRRIVREELKRAKDET